MANLNLNRYPLTEKYLKARKVSLINPVTRFSKYVKGDEVYGVVIDLPVAPRICASLVAYINGAANIHFNHGEEYVGAAKKYMSVVKAASLLVMQANKLLDKAEPTKTFELPSGTSHNVYLLTAKGIYKFVYTPSSLTEEQQDERVFNIACRNLMRELHEAQLKDRQQKNN